MKLGLKVRFLFLSLKLFFFNSNVGFLELDHAYALKKKQKKKENQKKNGLKTDLSSFSGILDTIEIKPKSEFASQATRGKKPEQVKEPAIPTNKIRSKKAKKNAE